MPAPITTYHACLEDCGWWGQEPALDDASMDECPRCHGDVGEVTPCPDCDGLDTEDGLIETICSHCNGTGYDAPRRAAALGHGMSCQTCGGGGCQRHPCETCKGKEYVDV